jgi:hypothetical protein
MQIMKTKGIDPDLVHLLRLRVGWRSGGARISRMTAVGVDGHWKKNCPYLNHTSLDITDRYF